MTKPGYETISGAEPGRIDRERKGKDDETAELHKPDGRWRKLAADKPALMLCHTGAEDARTESGEQNAQDMDHARSEEHTSELQSLMRISYAVFCLKKKT